MLAQTNIDNLPHGYAAAIQVADILLLQLSALKTSPSQLALHSNPHPLLLPIPVAPSGDVLHNSFCFCWRWLVLLSQCSQRMMQAGPHPSPPGGGGEVPGEFPAGISCARNTIGPHPHEPLWQSLAHHARNLLLFGKEGQPGAALSGVAYTAVI